MNYAKPEVVDALAAEYVLGTLDGAARRRFRSLLRDRADMRAAVTAWEQRLSTLLLIGEPQMPPESTWNAIEARIWPKRKGLWQSVSLWRSWSAMATAAVVVLALWLQPLLNIPTPPDHVGVIGAGDDPQWVVSANLDTGALTLRAVNVEATAVEQAFELWMLPQSGAPQSMGLLPVGGGTVSRSLPPSLLALLRHAKGLAVSVEPPGGSPTGQPTGAVIHTAELLSL